MVDTGAPRSGRLSRMTKGAWLMYPGVRAAKPTVAHFPDPEPIWVGLSCCSSFPASKCSTTHEDMPRVLAASLGASSVDGVGRRAGMVCGEGLRWDWYHNTDDLSTILKIG